MMVEAIRQGDIPGVQLRYRQPLAVGVEEAWEWLTVPAKLARWAADRARVDLGAGGTLRLESTRDKAALLVEEGETLDSSGPRRWVLAFRQLDSGWKVATRLTFELHPTASGCELDIFQEGFEHLSLSSCLTVWEEYRRRWRSAGARLAELTG